MKEFKKDIIYFDNAATSWPKPVSVIEGMNSFFYDVGGSSGRSGHSLSIDSARIVFNTRENLAELFNVPDSTSIVFLQNATAALNLAIFGLLKTGDHVITSSMEHNSVMRPLRVMEQGGVEISVLKCGSRGELDPHDLNGLIKNNTRAIFLTHASNVTGTIMPVAEVGKIARENNIVFAVDASQTAGVIDIDVKEMNIDLLAFTGHKSLLGPQGTGGIYIRKGLEDEISPLFYGGTGSRSELEVQPDFMPDKFESGTGNVIGLAGLGEGVQFILDKGLDIIREKEIAFTKKFIDGLRSMKSVTVYGFDDPVMRTSVVAFNLDGIMSSDSAFFFDEQFNIMSRSGLHCAPSAHETIGTSSYGTNRFSFGYFNKSYEIDIALKAIEEAFKNAP